MYKLFTKLLLITLLCCFSVSCFNNFKISKHVYEKQLSVDLYIENNKTTMNVVQGTNFGDIKHLINNIDNYDLSYYSDLLPLYDKEVIYLKNKTINKISINSNDVDLLITLPGIGVKTAQKIIDYRKVYGDYKYLEELKNVSGIGEKKFEAIKEYLTI